MQEEEHRELAEEEKKRLRDLLYVWRPNCGMELSEPTMLRKQIVAALLVPTLVFEETVKLYQESFIRKALRRGLMFRLVAVNECYNILRTSTGPVT